MLLSPPSSRPHQLGDLLEHVGVVLDISEELYLEAVRQYEAVGQHLGRGDSRLLPYAPRIYPQGSFRLGTMIQPVSRGCEYDVDLVCLLDMAKASTTQAGLKEMVGSELRLAYSEILRERRRCWTLQVKLKFHLDVLPSIPDTIAGGTAILLTDTDLLRWQHSDPKAYAQWFERRMASVVRVLKEALAVKLRANADQIPDWKVRTPLQRAVQLLKRHRDVFFEEDLDHRPASIIITTLAASAYAGETSLFDALRNIVAALPRAVSLHGGMYQVLNPVNPKENFADRWNEDPALARAFIRWVAAVGGDLDAWSASPTGIRHLSESLAARFGGGVVKKAVQQYGGSMTSIREAGGLAMSLGTGKLTSTPSSVSPAVTVRPHTFFGE